MPESSSIALLREKLEHLRRDEVIAFESEQKFGLRKKIEALEEQIAQLEQSTIQAPTINLLQPPLPESDFTGRKAELTALLADMQHSGVSISGLQGMGGVGKTQLALKLAEELTSRYPDAQFYLNLKGVDPQPMSVADAMSAVIRVYLPTDQLPEDAAQLTGIYRSGLQRKRALLVLDNAKDAAQVKPLLPPSSFPCGVIVTSRQLFYVPGLKQTHLDIMTPEDARALLLKIAPDIGEAEELAQRLGYLPLALRLAASFLAERINISATDYLRRLEIILARPEMKPVEASLCLSYDQFEVSNQQRWCALSVFPGDFDNAAAAAVWAIKPDDAQECLSELLSYSLVEWNKPTNRYHLHDLSREFSTSRLSQTNRATAQKHHAAHYKEVLATANNTFLQGSGSTVAGLELFDEERANIEVGQAWAAAHAENDSEAALLCVLYPNAGAYVLDLRQHPRERIAWLEAALYAAQRLKQREMEGIMLGNLGNAYAALGETRRAIEFHEQALVISREIGDRRGEGNALGNLGNAYAALGETRRAIEFHEQHLIIAREIGDRRGEGNALFNMSVSLNASGEPIRAMALAEAALSIFEQIESPHVATARARLEKWRNDAATAEK